MIKQEFIGKRIKIVDARNPSNIGIEGIVVDETKNMFIIDSGKKIIKENVVIEVDNEVVDGKKLAKRAEERIKG